MSSFMEMSLEEIIRKKRDKQRPKGIPRGQKLIRNINIKKNLTVEDARNKIISKKRNQISDARDKLAELAKQKDARMKLDLLRKKRMIQSQGKKLYNHRPKFPTQKNDSVNNEVVFTDRSRQVVSQPLSKSMMTTKRYTAATKKYMSRVEKPKPIMRMVQNDLEIIDDPMGDEYLPTKPSSLNRRANLQLRIVAHNNDLRESRSASFRSGTPDKEKSPPRPPSILKKRPMAALRTEKKVEKPSLEYRIIVSNLRNTVTGGDIEELFGDVGGMVESRLVRPGTAEVIYKSVEDAQKAVELYHNRQLDGQPMNCLLVTPRASATTTSRSSSKPALLSSNSNVEPDISTFHKVLFRNF